MADIVQRAEFFILCGPQLDDPDDAEAFATALASLHDDAVRRHRGEAAARAARALGYEFIGHNLLSEISTQLNLSEGEAEMYRRTSQSRLLRFVDR